MKYEQEIQARDLYRILAQEFAGSSPETEISIEGKGAHWTCTAVRGERHCSISPLLPKYFVSFDQDGETQAMGRTPSKKDAISAIGCWLQGHSVSKLYEAFEFVDHHKRFLKKLWNEIIETSPELEQCATIRLDEKYGDFYYLWFIAKDRSCRICFFGQNQFPTCEFYWDECHLFEVLTEKSIPLSLILRRWFCDYAMPSELEQEFSWLDTGKLAKYYEEGRGVEGEFILSWDSVEWFYRKAVNLPQSSAILKMIVEMRERGYDHTLRAGQSMYTFIVSRSRRHGLKANQPMIAFEFHKDGMDLFTEFGSERKLSYSQIEYTPSVDDLMKQLQAEKIS